MSSFSFSQLKFFLSLVAQVSTAKAPWTKKTLSLHWKHPSPVSNVQENQLRHALNKALKQYKVEAFVVHINDYRRMDQEFSIIIQVDSAS